MYDYLMGFPNNGYWGQVDIWFSKDAQRMRRAEKYLRAAGRTKFL